MRTFARERSFVKCGQGERGRKTGHFLHTSYMDDPLAYNSYSMQRFYTKHCFAMWTRMSYAFEKCSDTHGRSCHWWSLAHKQSTTKSSIPALCSEFLFYISSMTRNNNSSPAWMLRRPLRHRWYKNQPPSCWISILSTAGKLVEHLCLETMN